MGFRNNAYAKVWSVEPVKETITKCRISVAKKNKETGQYEQSFGGFVNFVGTASATKASKLKEGDSIQLKDVDVTTFYNKEKNITYTNYTCFDFDLQSSSGGGSPNTDGTPSEDFSDTSEEELPY